MALPPLRTVEFQLLANCGFLDEHGWDQQRTNVLRLLAEGPDPQQFVALVRRHRVQRLAYEVLTRATRESGRNVEWVRELLGPGARRVQMESLKTHAEWQRLRTAFGQARVQVHALKGTSLSERLYGEATMRHCRDIDLIVAPEDVSQACEVLEQCGYQVKHTLPAHLRHGFQLSLCRSIEWHIDGYRPESDTRVELHWRFEQVPHSGLEQRWFAYLRKAEADPHLQARFDLLYCCLHGASHAWMRFKWLSDVRVLVGRVRSHDWPLIIDMARQLRMETLLAEALLLLEDLAEFQAPESAFPLVDRNRAAARPLLPEALEWLSVPEESLAEKELSAIARAQRRRRRLHYRHSLTERMLHGLTTSMFSITDISAFRLPAWLLPLYPIIRPFSLCGRAVMGKLATLRAKSLPSFALRSRESWPL